MRHYQEHKCGSKTIVEQINSLTVWYMKRINKDSFLQELGAQIPTMKQERQSKKLRSSAEFF